MWLLTVNVNQLVLPTKGSVSIKLQTVVSSTMLAKLNYFVQLFFQWKVRRKTATDWKMQTVWCLSSVQFYDFIFSEDYSFIHNM